MIDFQREYIYDAGKIKLETSWNETTSVSRNAPIAKKHRFVNSKSSAWQTGKRGCFGIIPWEIRFEVSEHRRCGITGVTGSVFDWCVRRHTIGCHSCKMSDHSAKRHPVGKMDQKGKRCLPSSKQTSPTNKVSI
jgi:hypothetical protein